MENVVNWKGEDSPKTHVQNYEQKHFEITQLISTKVVPENWREKFGTVPSQEQRQQAVLTGGLIQIDARALWAFFKCVSSFVYVKNPD